MNKLIRGVVTGSLIGAGVGIAMLVMRNRNRKVMAIPASRGALGKIRMVRNKTMRWTSAVKDGAQAFSRKLAEHTP